ncbi:MAG: hypothetical protein NVS1B4_12580 [Gemmatimonadaceae bacterium]
MVMVGLALGVAAVLQQPGTSTGPSGDTTDYWQQRVRYEIVARLDERTGGGVVRARGRLTYVNNSPDTLREMYFHQYLNAFRPGSRWSATDEREGRVRFQNLRDPAYGYERFTAPVTVAMNGNAAPAAVSVDYPGSPDSTVARITLPHPLAPGDSVVLSLAWEARPSTVVRRQGRRGRAFDFAQWYPKVAVYDRGGWQPNALVPAGELYGEFGSYDVTLIVADDQVLGATGVPVSGDPGWERVRQWGVVRNMASAYGAVAPAAVAADSVGAGMKVVRFVARDVHHFAWSANPDFRYEGGVYVRPAPASRPHFPVWDTVAVHVLYRAGDDATWGNGVAVRRTQAALEWLNDLYGPYAYPQITNLHRLDTGGTEFPMLIADGTASQGLILHEAGHIYTYGALANNEWRAGWMDEGLTSYQTAWAQGLTVQDRAREAPAESAGVVGAGYGRHRVKPGGLDVKQIAQYRLDLLGRAEPLATEAHRFREFGIYDAMVYDRASAMYGQLRDVMGEPAFRRFLRGYYDRWALRHVDEAAMRAEAERAYGKPLGWFFEQWLHRTGLIDYALRSAEVRAEGAGWVTRARVVRKGEYRHPMPVGVRTESGWTIGRADPLADDQTVVIRTDRRPVDVRLDPLRVTEDWDRRNDVAALRLPGIALDRRVTRLSWDWPFVDMVDRDRGVVRVAPLVWSGTATGGVAALRVRSSVLGDRDRWEYGLGVAERVPGGGGASSRVQGWVRFENPSWPWALRPADGVRGAAYLVDGVALVDVARAWDRSSFVYASGLEGSVTLGALAVRKMSEPLAPGAFALTSGTTVETRVEGRLRTAGGWTASGVVGGGSRMGAGPSAAGDAFWWVRGETGRRVLGDYGATEFSLRGYASYVTDGTPAYRVPGLAAGDAIETFGQHWYRPDGAILKRKGMHYQPLGGAGLRGYDAGVLARRIVAVNMEAGRRVTTFGPEEESLGLWLVAFGDAGQSLRRGGRTLADAGVGVAVRGRLFDRSLAVRLDVPLWVGVPALAVGELDSAALARREVALRYALSFNELW